MDMQFTDEQIQELFGNEAAENESPERLREYYVKNEIYDQVHALLPLRLLVGHKGVGKSALLRISAFENEQAGTLCVNIRPDDVAGIGESTDQILVLIREWKEGLLRLIASKVLQSFGSESDGILDKAKSIGGRLIDVLQETLKNVQKVNLSEARNVLLEKFAKDRRIVVYIDDLDRGWQGRKQDIVRVSALLNAVRDLSGDNPGLSFKIGLRSDVYFLARTSDESTDKIEGSVVWHRWTNHQIFILLVKRIETYFGRKVDESNLMSQRQANLARYLDGLMDSRFEGTGKWEGAPIYRILMSLIRRRPRDLVKLLTLAGKSARKNKHTKMQTNDFKDVFEEYSQGRIQDTVNEYRSELPQIEKLLLSMRPSTKEKKTNSGFMYETAGLLAKLGDIMNQGTYNNAAGRKLDAKELAAFLYKINFIVARKEVNGEILRKYFEENRYLNSTLVDFGFDWEVHPAFRWALQPESIADLFAKLALSADE